MLFLMEETVWCSAGKQLQAYPELAVHTMSKMCIEAESTIDYGDAFKRIMANTPVPMSPLESLASSAVWTAHSAKAALILVLTRGGSTAKLVAKYWPGMPILSVVVPEIKIKTNSFDWSCSDESPARHSLIYRGLVPVLCSGSARGFSWRISRGSTGICNWTCSNGRTLQGGGCCGGLALIWNFIHHQDCDLEVMMSMFGFCKGVKYNCR